MMGKVKEIRRQACAFQRSRWKHEAPCYVCGLSIPRKMRADCPYLHGMAAERGRALVDLVSCDGSNRKQDVEWRLLYASAYLLDAIAWLRRGDPDIAERCEAEARKEIDVACEMLTTDVKK